MAKREWDFSTSVFALILSQSTSECPHFFAFKNLSYWCLRVLIPVQFFGDVKYINILYLNCDPYTSTDIKRESICSEKWCVYRYVSKEVLSFTQTAFILLALFLAPLVLKHPSATTGMKFSLYDGVLWVLLCINWENADYQLLDSCVFQILPIV